MLSIYKIIINIIFFFAPIILRIRVLKNKEHKTRFKEKLCYFTKSKPSGKLIWFHASSVGEVLSIIPLIEKIEKLKSIKTILVTSNTLSSSKVILKKNLKKTIHQFFPVDTNNLSKKFLNHWKPDLAIFVESEIWPNFINNIKFLNIPLILLNGRFTKKTFYNWKKIPTLAKDLFKSFNLCFAQNSESKKFLNYFGVKKVKNYGNLKYSQSSLENKNKKLFKVFNRKKIWCASSTHLNEEEICGKIHLKLKNKIKNLITIIIPRHVDRTEAIEKELNSINLKVQLHSKSKKISTSTDIYLVDTFGETNFFYNLSPIVFVGKSFNFHGGKSGQNPIEAARYGCKIFHGPNVKNFYEVYKFLEKIKITKKIYNQEELYKNLIKNIYLNTHKEKNKKILKSKGSQILNETFNEISNYL
tara:strand:- start:96 stop:1340 length:1245 start_codon:yes stop_codon:yes gene_type:complete